MFLQCSFLFVCSSRLWFLFRRPHAGARSKRHNPEPEHCAIPEAFSHPGPYRRQPTPGTRLARGRRAWAAQRRLVPVGRCHRRADTAPHLEAGARLGSASTQPRKPRPPGPPRCSAPRPGASSPGPRGRGSAAGGGGPSSAAGAAGQAVPVPQHCWAAESACRRLAAPAAQATWSASAHLGPGEGVSRVVGSDHHRAPAGTLAGLPLLGAPAVRSDLGWWPKGRNLAAFS